MDTVARFNAKGEAVAAIDLDHATSGSMADQTVYAKWAVSANPRYFTLALGDVNVSGEFVLCRVHDRSPWGGGYTTSYETSLQLDYESGAVTWTAVTPDTPPTKTFVVADALADISFSDTISITVSDLTGLTFTSSEWTAT